MKSIAKIEVFSFDELSDEAKTRAIRDYRYEDTAPYAFIDEFEDTLKELEKLFKVSCFDWSFSSSNYTYRLRFADWNSCELRGNRARAWLANNVLKYAQKPIVYRNGNIQRYSKISYTSDCSLTGYWLDDEGIEPALNFLRGRDKYGARLVAEDNKHTLEDIIRACFDSLFDAVQKDCEYQESDEAIAETIMTNDYEFTADGKMWAGYPEAESAA